MSENKFELVETSTAPQARTEVHRGVVPLYLSEPTQRRPMIYVDAALCSVSAGDSALVAAGRAHGDSHPLVVRAPSNLLRAVFP